jgi:magnesium-transporting ATPase (P-type)
VSKDEDIITRRDLLQINALIITMLIFILGFFADTLINVKEQNQRFINNYFDIFAFFICSLLLFFFTILLLVLKINVKYSLTTTFYNMLLIGYIIFELLVRLTNLFKFESITIIIIYVIILVVIIPMSLILFFFFLYKELKNK